MPTFRPETLLQIGQEIFTAIGCSVADAHTVAEHLVESSLFGHDSHGVIRLYEYVRFVQDGVWDPRGVPQIVEERLCTAVVDGGGAMGQVGGQFANELAMAKAAFEDAKKKSTLPNLWCSRCDVMCDPRDPAIFAPPQGYMLDES